jgi:hypothetical protein
MAELTTRVKELEEMDRPEHAHLLDYYREFVKQPPEQLSGIRSTVFNYLQPYTAPDLRRYFAPAIRAELREEISGIHVVFQPNFYRVRARPDQKHLASISS